MSTIKKRKKPTNGHGVTRRELDLIIDSLAALFDTKLMGHQAWLEERFKRSDEARGELAKRLEDIEDASSRWKVVAVISVACGGLIVFLGNLILAALSQ
jgi:hypothetical protein